MYEASCGQGILYFHNCRQKKEKRNRTGWLAANYLLTISKFYLAFADQIYRFILPPLVRREVKGLSELLCLLRHFSDILTFWKIF